MSARTDPSLGEPDFKSAGTLLRTRFKAMDDEDRPELIGSADAVELLHDICDALESGTLRVVEGDGIGRWWVQPWLKRALRRLSAAGTVITQQSLLPGSELSTLGWCEDRPVDRRVPAGSFLRRGAYIAPGVTIMPPSTIQAGAAILEGASIDSHVLVGSTVLVGEGSIVGCGTMLGGSLSPEEALPVVLERGVIIGGNCGLYGSIVLGEGATMNAGTILRSHVGVYHAIRRIWMKPGSDGTLHLPSGCTLEMGVPPSEAFSDGLQRLATIIAD